MLTWIAPIIVFGLVIFVHELGHFIAAKLVGVYAPRFSIGFGPSLFKKRWGETEYVIAALPLGGYVRMASREDEATAFMEGGSENSAVAPGDAKKDGFDPEAMIPFGPRPIPESRWFESKSLSERLFIMLAGVTMNAVLAYVIYAGLIMRSGIPTPMPVAAMVTPGKPAALAGIQAGDSIATLNGERLENWEVLLDRIGASAGVPLTLGIVRAGRPTEIVVTPAAEVAPDPRTGIKRRVGRIGMVAKEGFIPVALPRALGEAWNITLDKGTAIFETLGALFSRGVGVSELGGPIAIAQVSVQAARGGIENLLALIALISINVAVFNLLPIPILDGGQIVLNVAESIKGSAFSMKTRERILKGGLVIIAALFVTVMFNDISRNMQGIVRLVGRLFGSA
ncbi:MAG TPA: M50 family metallopeptidase [Gemmatimonadaceae bacterium]|nr:M50 family metallopeptidase [Gemmatimonadaceae bacterium]